MKRITNQNGQPGPGNDWHGEEFLLNDQNRFILVVNDEMELLYSSPKARKQLRLPKIGEKINSRDIVHHSDERLVFEGVRMALKDQQIQCYQDLRMAAQPEPIAAELKFEAYPSAADNENRVLMEWFPLEDKETNKIVNTKDSESAITQMSRAMTAMEDAMRRMKKELVALNRENAKLRVFAMSASHDLRSPLMCWRYCLELITQYDSEQKRLEACHDGRRAAQRFETLLDLLDELVYDEKMRGGRAKTIKAADVMKTVLFLLELDVNHTKAAITYDFSLLPEMRYPKAFLAIILLNLLSNACKYRDSNRELKINVSTAMQNGKIILKITDNGIGMTEDVIQTYLFQAFARPKQQQHGRGLGLYIVKSIIDQSGGQIDVISTPGEGSIFHISLNPYMPLAEKVN